MIFSTECDRILLVMNMFFKTKDTIPEGLGFETFGPTHLIWLLVAVVLCVLACVLYKRLSDGKRKIMLTVLGAAPLAAGVIVSVPAAITGVAKYIAIVGVVLIILTSSRSGNIIFRLFGGLYGLYNIASGYLSDILSYSRLLALGLATKEEILGLMHGVRNVEYMEIRS